jgi:hypothetical protein
MKMVGYDLFSLGSDGKESDDDVPIEAPKLRDIDPIDRRRVVVPPGAK